MKAWLWVVACALIVAAPEAAEQTSCPGMLYLGNGLSNGLFVDVPTQQAVYAHRIEEPQPMLQAMRQFHQQRNVESCGDKCVHIRLEEGTIVLAFRPGTEGFRYEFDGVKFSIAEVVKSFGLGLGDLYWIEYRSGDRNNPAGIFLYSSAQGVLSLSMTDHSDPRTSALGSTLSLVGRRGLLSDDCAVR
jgi:hypothetical protein